MKKIKINCTSIILKVVENPWLKFAMILISLTGYAFAICQILKVENKVEKVGTELSSLRLKIYEPKDQSTLDSNYCVVKGNNPFGDKNVYILVMPLSTNQQYIVSAVTQGYFTLSIKIGENYSKGMFNIVLMATKNQINAGPMISIPQDAIWSENILIERI
jgi:hypothetical protein